MTTKRKYIIQRGCGFSSPAAKTFFFFIPDSKREPWGERQKNRQKGKNPEFPFSANKLTFHQLLLHILFTFIGLDPRSITKVLTGSDYCNKSCSHRRRVTKRTGMLKGLLEGQR